MLFSKLIPTAFAVEAATDLVYKFPGQQGNTVADPGTYINTVFTFALGVVGLFALGFLVYGGIRYILSAGNPTALADARSRMLSALIGVGILLGSYLILNTIDPRLLDLSIRKVDTVTPGSDINLSAMNALTDKIIKAIEDGNTKAARALLDEARKQGLNELRFAEGEVVSKNPVAAAKYFMEELTPGEQKLFLSRSSLNRPGIPGYDAQSEYNYSQLIQRVPVETIFTLYPSLAPDAQRDLLMQASDIQRQAFYWHLDPSSQGGSSQQQEAYLKTLSDFNRSQLYLDFQKDGTGKNHDLQLARQIANLGDVSESTREIVGIWASLPEGAVRQTFLKQVESAGWNYIPAEVEEAVNQRNLGNEDRADEEYLNFIDTYPD